MAPPSSNVGPSPNGRDNDIFSRADISEVPEIPSDQDTRLLPPLALRVKFAESDHDNLHKITNMLIYTSGFLLTICMGAIYFSYTNSSTHLPLTTKILLFSASFLLSVAVLSSVNTLHLQPRTPPGFVDYAEVLEEVCDDKRWCTDLASYLLQLAVLILLIGIIFFAADRYFSNPNLISELKNITHYSIEIKYVAQTLIIASNL